MLISLQKNQTKIEEHINSVHGEVNHFDVVFAILIIIADYPS